MYLDSVQIIGFVGKDPERRQARGNGAVFTVLSAATQRTAPGTGASSRSRTCGDGARPAPRAGRAIAIEGKLIDVYLTDGNEDLNRHPSQLYQKLTALYDKNEADQGPSASATAVNDSFRQWMAQSAADLRQFQQRDVPAFNSLLKSHNLTLAIEP